MKLFKAHKDIEIDKRFGNVRITTIKYSKPIENSDKWEHYTEVSCWHDTDCENCPCGWESGSYEGECDDCGRQRKLLPSVVERSRNGEINRSYNRRRSKTLRYI